VPFNYKIHGPIAARSPRHRDGRVSADP